MGYCYDLVGRRYGDCAVIARMPNGNGGHSRWKCRCKCGMTFMAYGHKLTGGMVERCPDCQDKLTPLNRRHGECKTALWHKWRTMRDVVYNWGSPHFSGVGGAGIKIDPEFEDYISFRDWALANGYEDGLCLVRKDMSKDYSPDNCEFITKSEISRRSAVTSNKNRKRRADT